MCEIIVYFLVLVQNKKMYIDQQMHFIKYSKIDIVKHKSW
jgi:hypothetical protein